MKHNTSSFFALVLLSILALSPAAVSADTAPAARSTTALRIAPHHLKPPKIDGRLDDAVWQQAPFASDFLQLDPVEGEAASEKTTVQVAYDEEGLYVGIRCYDSDPAGHRIAADAARRRDRSRLGVDQSRSASRPPDRALFLRSMPRVRSSTVSMPTTGTRTRLGTVCGRWRPQSMLKDGAPSCTYPITCCASVRRANTRGA